MLRDYQKHRVCTLLDPTSDGKEAARCGFATRAVARERLDDTVDRMADEIARVPLEILMMKKLAINRSMDLAGMREAKLALARLGAVMVPVNPDYVEKITDDDLLADPVLAAGTLPGFYVEAVAVAENGAWPLPLPDHYAADGAHLAEYAKLAATPEGFAEYLDRYVHERHAA